MGRKMMVFAAVATVVMLTTVFSSAVLKSSSSLTGADTYNSQVRVSAPILMRHNARVHSGSGSFDILNSNPAEKNWLAKAYGYAYEKYGVNASSNRLDFLQYESMIGFFKWYSENFEQLPVERRNFAKSSLDNVFRLYVKTNPGTVRILNEITSIELSNYEHTITAEFSNITLNGQGTPISNISISYRNSSAYVLTYSYHLNYTTFHYSMLLFNGKKTLIDPIVMENEFQLWDWIIHYGTSYNINIKFTNYANALKYESVIVDQTNTYAAVLGLLLGVVFTIAIPFVGAAAVSTGTILAWLATEAGQTVLGLTGTLIGAIAGITTGSTLESNVHTLFNLQWNAHGYFWVVYTVNVYFYISNSASIWGPVTNGIYQIFTTGIPLPTTFQIEQYVSDWRMFASFFGQNTWVWASAPNWIKMLDYWP